MGNTNHIGDTNACRAYIDKLALFWTNHSQGKVVIGASAGGYENSRYWFEQAGNAGLAERASVGVSLAGVSPSDVVKQPLVSFATNVAGYFGGGIHANWPTTYPTDSSIVFVGSSSWYIMTTEESFNGLRFGEISPLSQGTFIGWFSDKAFGGTNFSNTPVGAIAYTDEPGRDRNDTMIFYGYWASGRLFSSAAWASRGGLSAPMFPHFQAVGDPFVRR